MFNWLVDHKIPLGDTLKVGVDFLNDHAQFFFDFVSNALGAMVAGMTALLLAVPAFVLIAMIAAGAYALHRSIGMVVFIILSLILVINLGYWQATIETLSLVIWSTAACVHHRRAGQGSSPRTGPGSTPTIRPDPRLDADDPDLRLPHPHVWFCSASGRCPASSPP